MTPNAFYSDRLNGETPRVLQALHSATAMGLFDLVTSLLSANWLADDFPERCPDVEKRHIFGTNDESFWSRARALIPELEVPIYFNRGTIRDETLFDLLELVGRFVKLPTNGSYHQFFDHYALKFDRAAGAKQYREGVNEILARGRVAFEMNADMTIRRIGPVELREALSVLNPNTGDGELDKLIEDGRRLVASRRPAERLSGIQSLWGALERLKTIDVPGKNKKHVSAEALLDHIESEPVRAAVRADLFAVTALGNQFRVRHHETDVAELPEDAYDYFIGRVVTVLHVLLDHSARLAK